MRLFWRQDRYAIYRNQYKLLSPYQCAPKSMDISSMVWLITRCLVHISLESWSLLSYFDRPACLLRRVLSNLLNAFVNNT